MDIWRWLTEAQRGLMRRGHVRLARALDELPSLVVDEEHDAVDALVAEALPLARAADNPWLEVFVRHWALQSRVLHRYEAREHIAALREEVAQTVSSDAEIDDELRAVIEAVRG